MTSAHPYTAKTTHYDVIIIGGGLVGGSLAAGLAKYGIRTAVIDKDDQSTLLDAAYDGRCSALALACQKVLDQIGLWDSMRPHCQPILDIRVADGDSLMFLDYHHQDVGNDPFGYMVENRIMRKAIYEFAANTPNMHVHAPTTMTRLETGEGMMTVHLNTGEKLTASLVIGADGRQSQVRNAVNIGIKGWSYGQTAVVLSVDHDKSHEGIAYEHFQPGGPFAILPMYNDAGESKRAAIVWTEKDTLAQALIAADDATFRAEFTKRFGTFLGDFDFVGPRFSYPLSLQFADRYVAHRVALVGDAAHGMHPVAGQGMNMGVRDVAAMVECLVEAYRLGQDLGAPHILEKYQSLRRSDNLLMLGLTDALVRLFSNDIPPIALARRLGMHALQHMIGPKKFFMKHAMGMVGTPPKMMRGEPL